MLGGFRSKRRTRCWDTVTDNFLLCYDGVRTQPCPKPQPGQNLRFRGQWRSLERLPACPIVVWNLGTLNLLGPAWAKERVWARPRVVKQLGGDRPTGASNYPPFSRFSPATLAACRTPPHPDDNPRRDCHIQVLGSEFACESLKELPHGMVECHN